MSLTPLGDELKLSSLCVRPQRSHKHRRNCYRPNHYCHNQFQRAGLLVCLGLSELPFSMSCVGVSPRQISSAREH
jgi:hypothetical protein